MEDLNSIIRVGLMEFLKIKNPLGTLKKIEMFSLQREGVCTKFVEC